MRTMMNAVRTKLSDEGLLNVNGGIVVYVSDTGKYWAVSDDGGLFQSSFSYDQQNAMDLARQCGFSTQLYTKEDYMAEFKKDARIFYE